MTWTCEKTVVGYLVVFKIEPGEIWFQPTEYGHVRSIFSTAPGVTLDLQQLARIGSQLRGTLPTRRYGSKLSQDRGNYCGALCGALNAAMLFPARKAVAA